MKKLFLQLFVSFWIINIYSCSEEPELNNPFAGGSNSTVSGNAIYFHPSYLEVSSSAPFKIEVHVQEVINLVSAEIEFSYDKNIVDFISASVGSLFLNIEENILIDENNLDIERVLITLATALDGGLGLSGNGSFIELTFNPKTTGLLQLQLDLSLESGICPWHEFSDDHSIYIENSDPTNVKAFQSLNNATVIIQ